MGTVEELELQVAQLQKDFAEMKADLLERIKKARLESKGYAAETVLQIETLQDQINRRFELANTRLDAMNELIEKSAEETKRIGRNTDELLSILRGNIGRANLSGPQDEGEEDPQ